MPHCGTGSLEHQESRHFKAAVDLYYLAVLLWFTIPVLDLTVERVRWE